MARAQFPRTVRAWLPRVGAGAAFALLLAATTGCGNRIETASDRGDDGGVECERPCDDSSPSPPSNDSGAHDRNTDGNGPDTGIDMADAGISTCGDGLDNDGDGKTDLADPNCDAISGSEFRDDAPDDASDDTGDASEDTGDDAEPTLTPTYRINSGGPELSGSPVWEADNADNRSPYLSGTGQQFGGKYEDDPEVTVDDEVPESAPDRLFDSERFDGEDVGEMTYRFDVDAGQHRVRLYFCETWQGATEPGVRRFDVTINGRTVLSDYEIYEEVGGFTGTVEAFDLETDDGEDIAVTFHRLPDGNNPMVAGLELLSVR